MQEQLYEQVIESKSSGECQEAGDKEQEAKSRRPGAGGQKQEARGRRPEVGGQGKEARERRSRCVLR